MILLELVCGSRTKDKWSHPLQHKNDAFLMDQFICIPRITPSQLKQANKVCLYLRVLIIADLADPSGKFIPDGALEGEWQGGLDIHWPYQALPPKLPILCSEYLLHIYSSSSTNTLWDGPWSPPWEMFSSETSLMVYSLQVTFYPILEAGHNDSLPEIHRNFRILCD